MLSDEIQAQYPSVDDFDATTNSQVNSSAQDEEYEEEELEFTKIRRENVFQQVDYTKRKTKIICTLG
jgi:hypothetical protein